MIATIFLLLFPPLIEGGTTYLPVTVIRLFTIACVLAWILGGSKNGSIKVPRSVISLSIIFFAIISLFGYFIATYKYLAWQRLVSILDYILLLYVFIYSINSERLKRSVYIISIFAAAEAAYGIFQAVTGAPKVNGTFFNPDFYGGWLAMTAPVVLSIFFVGSDPRADLYLSARRGRRALRIISTLIFFLLLLSAILLTHSRGAFLAVSFSCAVFLLFRYGWKGLVPVIAGMALAILLSPSLGQKFMGISARDPYIYSRLDIWKNAIERIIEKLLGEGLGQYRLYTFSHNFPAPDGPVRYSKVAESAHDGYLQVAAEMGVPGLLVLLWGLFALGRRSFKAIRREGDLKLAACAAGLSAFLFHAIFDSVFMEPGLVILALFYAAALLKPGTEEKIIKMKNTSFIRYGSIFAALLLAVYISLPFAAWARFGRFSKEKEPCGKKAVEELESAVILAPGEASYHSALASCLFNVYLKSGNPSAAKASVSELQDAIQLSPRDPAYPSRMGYVYEILSARAAPDKRKEVLLQDYQWYKKASTLAPYSPFDKLNAARVAGALGMARERSELLLDALKYEPDFLPARLELAKDWLSAGKTDQARAELARIEKTTAFYSSRGYDIMARRFGVNPAELRKLEDNIK